MNKNTIAAFLLIILSISFFTSKFYYEKVLKIPHPSTVAQQTQEKKAQNRDVAEVSSPSISQVKQDKPVHSDIISSAISSIPETDSQKISFDTVWVETDNLIVGISQFGAKIISVKTKNYRIDPVGGVSDNNVNPLIELVSDASLGGTNLTIDDFSYDNLVFGLSNSSKNIRITGADTVDVKFFIPDSSGREVLYKIFKFSGQGYLTQVEISSPDLNGKKVALGWLGGIAESEPRLKKSSSGYDLRKVHLFDGKSVYQISEKKESKSVEPGFYKWISLTSKYFVISLISDTARDQEVVIESYQENRGETSDKKQEKIFNYKLSTQRFATSTSEKYSIYIGPSQLEELKKHNLKLEKTLFGGWKWFFWADQWFPMVCEFVLWLLIMLQRMLHDYGLVIIVLTVLSRVVTYPLTHSSMKSMNRMRDLQPKIQELRDKYKNDAKKMNQKMMELYKKEGVNPLNPGCLPMFLQMPVFIALFIVLQKSIELRGSGTLLVPWIHDLSKPEILPIPFINPLPFEIPMYGSNVALLPIIMAILTYFQNKATIKDPNQKMMIYFMPVFMLLLFNNFPSGLVLYWTFSSALAIVQQYWTDYNKKKSQPVTNRAITGKTR